VGKLVLSVRLMLVLAAMLISTACWNGSATVGYRFPFVPVELSLHEDGRISVTTGASLVTPLGTLSVSGGVSTQPQAGHTLLYVTHEVNGVSQTDPFDINEVGPVAMCLDGHFSQKIDRQRIDLAVLSATSRINLVDGNVSADPCSSLPKNPVPALNLDMSLLAGVWQGSYHCSQGETGLRLEISTNTDSTLTAKFIFYPISSNPGVPSGSFAMVGKYSETGIVLRQDHWIDQPAGYTMVDLTGLISTKGDHTFSGTVEVAGCTSFSLQHM
jgi:hypothetical protein